MSRVSELEKRVADLEARLKALELQHMTIGPLLPEFAPRPFYPPKHHWTGLQVCPGCQRWQPEDHICTVSVAP